MSGINAACFCLTFVTLFVSCFLLGFSFNTLDPIEMGLKYNANTLQLMQDQIYGAQKGDGGRFFTGLGVFFKKFPKTLQKVVFSTGDSEASGNDIGARTKDGLSVDLGVGVQYKFKRNAKDLYNCFKKYEGNENAFYQRFIRTKVRDTAAKYFVNEYFAMRSTIRDQMLTDLKARFQTEEVDIVGLQLLNINLPVQIVNAIEVTAIANEKIGQALFDQQALRVSANTRILTTEQDNRVLLLNSQARGLATNITANAEAVRIATLNQARKDAFLSLRGKLNMTNTELLKYIWIDSMASNSALKTVLNVDVPQNIKLL
jgi:regulator of protease activity HflC (stomatin/prohibitin superfamily)